MVGLFEIVLRDYDLRKNGDVSDKSARCSRIRILQQVAVSCGQSQSHSCVNSGCFSFAFSKSDHSYRQTDKQTDRQAGLQTRQKSRKEKIASQEVSVIGNPSSLKLISQNQAKSRKLTRVAS